MRSSKVLSRIPERDSRVSEYEFDPDNDMGYHWLHLRYPYTIDGAGAIHENTVADCLERLKEVVPYRRVVNIAV